MVRQIGNMLSFDRRGLLRAAIGAAFLAPKVAIAQAPQQVGSVEDIKGEAFADSRDKRRTLERAAPLYLTDVVAHGTGFRPCAASRQHDHAQTRSVGAPHHR